jgi:hypothetical protein
MRTVAITDPAEFTAGTGEFVHMKNILSDLA